MSFYILQLGCFNWRRQSEEAAVGLRVLYSQMLNYFLGLGLENVSKSCEMCILIADSERRFLLIRRTSARVWRTDARPHRNTETRADGGSAEGGSCRGQCGDVRDQGTYTTSPRVCVWDGGQEISHSLIVLCLQHIPPPHAVVGAKPKPGELKRSSSGRSATSFVN